MRIEFHKYEGAGNDFVMLDNRSGDLSLSTAQLKKLADRHFGVGSDGVILIEQSQEADFAMRFFNPDGTGGMMCGNGGRCAVRFAHSLNACGESCVFLAPDGIHRAEITQEGIVLAMRTPSLPISFAEGVHLDTGTSHFVTFVSDLEEVDVQTLGRRLRCDERFARFGGCNVNFVNVNGRNDISVRTYERGVEAETLACGTGVTAAALATALKQGFADGRHQIRVHASGGELAVGFTKYGETFTHVSLRGDARFVFKGEIDL